MKSVSKRKNAAENSPRPKSKQKVVHQSSAPPSAQVEPEFIQCGACPPVIVSTPGIELGRRLSFHAYDQKRPDRSRPREFILHENSHPTLQYTAKEDRSTAGSTGSKNYIALYDSATGAIQVIEAKKMTARAMVKARQAPASAMESPEILDKAYEMRAELGQVFGTRKAKKALEDRVRNAIAAPSQDGSPQKLGAADRATMAVIGEVTSTMASREELQAAVDEGKPVPKANMNATQIEDVYIPDELIGAEVLNSIRVTDWKNAAEQGENVEVTSQFVARRLVQVARGPNSSKRLRLLRYLLYVISFYAATKPMKGGRKLMPRNLFQKSTDAPDAIVDHLRRVFSDGQGVMNKYQSELLTTHCLAYASVLENFEFDTADLKADLKIEQTVLNQYYREIGGRVTAVTDKATKQTKYIAKLSLPLQFPQQRRMARPSRRR